MKATQIRKECPVTIGQQYKGGKVICIIGDSDGYDVWTKHEQIGTTSGLIKMPIHREVYHKIDRQ